MQRVRRMPTTNLFDAGIREMHKYWSQQEPEFTKQFWDCHVVKNGLWGNCHGPFCMPSSQSVLENGACRHLKAKMREFAAMQRAQTGLPLRFGVGLSILSPCLGEKGNVLVNVTTLVFIFARRVLMKAI